MTRSLLVAFLLAGGICLGYAYSLFMAFEWTASTEAMTFTRGHIVESRFVTEDTIEYDIVLSVSLNDQSAMDQLAEIFKQSNDQRQLDLAWTLTGQDGSASEGQLSLEPTARVTKKTMDYVVGSFSAKENERCSLETRVVKSSKDLIGHSAELKVVVGQETANHYGLRGVIYLLVGLSLFSVAMILACYLIFRWVQEQKKVIEALKSKPPRQNPG
ncbi:MAG: hypothetical protein P1V97_37395 [Planctomycetota bacterium]|nr:hypothetical protein [Planctomycetota bacterium]